MAMHPHDPDTVHILPLVSDQFRCVPAAKLRVYRTRDGGRSWNPLARGPPQKGAYETVLRHALAVDALDPAGVYFGTRSGKLYSSPDEGSTWRLILDGLPPGEADRLPAPRPEGLMGAVVRIPGLLRRFTAGKSEVEIEGKPGTVSEALAALWARYPAVRDRIVAETRRSASSPP